MKNQVLSKCRNISTKELKNTKRPPLFEVFDGHYEVPTVT